jgi:transcriptional regulator with XRE-family HTH domain
MLSDKTDAEIIQELGDRLRQYRLQRNITQAELAERTGLHLNTVKHAELGHDPQLTTVVKILRGLNRLEALDAFLPPPMMSPLQLAKMKKKKRQRARRVTNG